MKRFERAQNYASYLPSVFLKQLAKEDYAYLQEKLHHYKGFYIQKRVIREYPIKSAAKYLAILVKLVKLKLKKSLLSTGRIDW